MLTVWRLIPHTDSKNGALAWQKRNGKIAVGWGAIGDLTERSCQSADEVGEAIKQEYGVKGMRNSGDGGTSLWRLFHEMKEEDLVLVKSENDSVVMEVVGPYEWVPENPDIDGYLHLRPVDVTELDADRTLLRAKLNPVTGQNPRHTLIRVGTIESSAGLSR